MHVIGVTNPLTCTGEERPPCCSSMSAGWHPGMCATVSTFAEGIVDKAPRGGMRKRVLLGERGTVAPLLASVATAPMVSTAGAGSLHLQSSPDHADLEDLLSTDVGIVTRSRGGGGGQSPANWLLSWWLAVSIDLSPFTKIWTRPSFAEAYLGPEDPPKPAVLAHRFSICGGSWHQHIEDPHGNNLQRGGQNGGAVLTSPSSHRQRTAPCLASTCSVTHCSHPPVMPVMSRLRALALEQSQGGGGDQSERSENGGKTFGKLPLFNTATHQQLLDCTHSKAHDFKQSREEEEDLRPSPCWPHD